MKRRWIGYITLFLTIALLMGGLLYFYGTIQAAKKEAERKVVDICISKTRENGQDIALIEQQLNTYLKDETDFRVHLISVDFESYSQEYFKNLQSKEAIDIIAGNKAEMEEAVKLGLLQPLDRLLQEKGQGILETLDTNYTDTGYVDGIRYGLTTMRDYGAQACFEYNKELAARYRLELDQVETLDDLEAVFTDLKEQNPDIIAVANTIYVGADGLVGFDAMGDSYSAPLAVLEDFGRSQQVVNLYESPHFYDFAKRMYDWRKNGWLMEDRGFTMSAINYLKSDRVLGAFSHYHPGFEVEESRGAGKEVGCIILGEPYVNSYNTNRHFWEITKKSDCPEEAMEFLNLMYTDREVVTYLSYGIEGRHYEYKDEDKMIVGYPKGVNADNSGYSQFRGWMYGNETIGPVWEGNVSHLWQLIKEYDKSANKSLAIDFTFRPEGVEEAYQACTSIAKEYYKGLINGYLDPDEYLPLLNEKLKAAGLGLIIEEKQRQLNEYLKEEE